jgi:hypothetical protein
MYILDFGEMRVRGGQERIKPGTGRIFRLAAAEDEADEPATTRPAR